MNNALKVLVAGLGLTAFAAQADSDPISFNYAQLSASHIKFKTDDDKASAMSLEISQSFGEMHYVFAEADLGETDEGEEDYQRISAGLGVHILKNESTTSPTEVYLGASYEQVSFEDGGVKADDEGFGLRLGVRTMAWNHIEMGAEVGLDKFDDAEAYGVTGTIGVRIIKNLGVYASYSYDDITPDDGASGDNAVTNLSIGVRGIW